MGQPKQFTPTPVERPGDKNRRIEAQKKAQTVRKKIEETKWREA